MQKLLDTLIVKKMDATSRNLPDKQVTIFLYTTLFILGLHAAMQPFGYVWLKVAFFSLLIVCFTTLSKPIIQPLIWISILTYFSFQLFIGYLWAANHHYVSVYLIIAIIIFIGTTAFNQNTLKFHIRFLLGCILCFSALHKFLSPDYINGAFLQMQIDFGHFLKPLKTIVPDWQLHKEENLAAYRKMIATNPNSLPAYALKYPISHTSLLAKTGSWLSIFMEVLAGVCIFSFPAKKSSHFILLSTILGVFVFRLETGFLSLLAVMGFYLAPNKMMAGVYLFLIGIFSVMIITGLGLR